MSRLLIIVEGPTERAVVEQILAPYFGSSGLDVRAKVLGTAGHKGGIRGFSAVQREITKLMRQEPQSFVSTFFDFYGLPSDWPGLAAAHGKSVPEKALAVERAMLQIIQSVLDDRINSKRFIPYVQMHELEALLFSNPDIMASVFEKPELAPVFAAIVHRCGGCEEIDDSPDTAPSRRITKLFPAYRKGASQFAHAPIIARRIGLNDLRHACPHFNNWLERIEGVAQKNYPTYRKSNGASSAR